MTGNITQGVAGKLSGGFFSVPGLVDVQHGYSAIIAADLLLYQRRIRFRIGWEHALWMWVYALTWFVINDAIKVAAYKFLRDREHFF